MSLPVPTKKSRILSTLLLVMIGNKIVAHEFPDPDRTPGPITEDECLAVHPDFPVLFTDGNGDPVLTTKGEEFTDVLFGGLTPDDFPIITSQGAEFTADLFPDSYFDDPALFAFLNLDPVFIDKRETVVVTRPIVGCKEGGTIADVDVGIHYTHGELEEAKVTLTVPGSPNDIELVLLDQVPSYNAFDPLTTTFDYVFATLDDEAQDSAPANSLDPNLLYNSEGSTFFGLPGGPGLFKPAESLSALDDIEVDGGEVWTFTFNNAGSEIPSCLFEIIPFVTCDYELLDAGGAGDPMIFGLQNQVFLFEGQDERWYSAIASPLLDWTWKLNAFVECENGLEPTYFTSSAMSLKNEDGSVADRVLVDVIDTSEFFPGCPYDDEACLGEGNLRLVINEEVITKPGAYPLSDGGKVYAFNAFGPCSYKRDVHMQDALLAEKALQTEEERRRRRLTEADPWGVDALDILKARLSKVEDPDACLPWIEAKMEAGDLYEANGGWTTIYIETADSLDFHIEYRQEVDRCQSHSIDTFIMAYPAGAATDPSEWDGVLGETRQLKHDSVTGEAIMAGREHVLSRPDDAAYEVEGPWSTDFEARRK